MGQSKHYRSPWNLRRSAQRLVFHLHKLLKGLRYTIQSDRMNTDYSEMLNDNTSDTFSISEEKKDQAKIRKYCWLSLPLFFGGWGLKLIFLQNR